MPDETTIAIITANRKYIREGSIVARQNLAMLHNSLRHTLDEEGKLSIALNDSYSAVIFSYNFQSAIDISQRVLHQFPHTTFTMLVAEHECIIGRSYSFLGRYDEAFEHLHRAGAMAFADGSSEAAKELRADILINLAMNTHRVDQQSPETEAYLRRSLSELGPTGHDNLRAACLQGLGNAMMTHARLPEALSHYREALDLFDRQDNHTSLSTARVSIAHCLIEMGDLAGAGPYLQQALDHCLRLGSYSEIAHCYLHLAGLREREGDIDAAYQAILQAMNYAMVSQVTGLQSLISQRLEALASLRLARR